MVLLDTIKILGFHPTKFNFIANRTIYFSNFQIYQGIISLIRLQDREFRDLLDTFKSSGAK